MIVVFYKVSYCISSVLKFLYFTVVILGINIWPGKQEEAAAKNARPAKRDAELLQG